MNKTTEALKLCIEALPNILFAATERDKKNRIRMFDNCVYQAQEALEVGREALSEPVKHEVNQEPVAWIDNKTWCFTYSQYEYEDLDEDMTDDLVPLYTAPVDAKAIRAEALEEAAKRCDDYGAQCAANENWEAEDVSLTNAAEIRGLK